MNDLLEKPATNVTAAPTLKRQAVRGGMLILATRLLTQIFNWTVTLLVARLLEPFDYGLMAAGTVLVGLVDLLAEGGLGKALIQKKTLEARDLNEAFTLNLVLGIGLYGALFLLAGPVALYLATPEFVGFLRCLGLVLLLIPFKAVPLALLDRDLRMGRQSAVHVAAALIQTALVLVLAVSGIGYWALLTGVIASRLVEAFALTWLAGWRPRLAWPGVAACRLLAFGLPATGASLLWFLYSNSDFAIVEALLGTTALGFYAFAFQLISLPAQKLTANVNQVAFPVFCRLTHEPARLKSWFLRLTVLLGFFGFPALGGLILVAPDAFHLIFGPKWDAAMMPFQLLGGAGMVMIVATTFPPLFNALGRPGINLQYAAACTLLLPGCFFAGGYVGGLTGVCLAWLTVYPAIVATFITLTRRWTGVGLSDLVSALTPILWGLAAMAAAVLVIQFAVAAEPVGVRLSLAIVAGAAAYCGWMLAFARATVVGDVFALWRELKAKQAPVLVEASA